MAFLSRSIFIFSAFVNVGLVLSVSLFSQIKQLRITTASDQVLRARAFTQEP